MYSAATVRSSLILAAFAISACGKENTKPTAVDAGTASASHEAAYPSGTPLDRPAIRSQPVRTKFPCRAIEAVNKPTLVLSPIGPASLTLADAGNNLLVRDMQIPEGDWIDLTTGAKVTAKSPRTLRETTYEGPARVRPCVDHDEEAWVLGGTFSAVSPGNESPGAEEWVITPLGVVRYVTSTLTIKANKRSMDLKVTGGTAYVLAAPYATLKEAGRDAGAADAGKPTWARVDAIYAGAVVATTPDDKIPAAAVEACKTAASASKVVTAALMEPDASIGTLAGEATDARRLARALCGVAALVVGKLPDGKTDAKPKPGTSKAELQAGLEAAEKDWRQIP